MNCEKKLVTVVIPTIGGERRQATLEKGIESLLSQTIPFDEILVFDNSKEQDVRRKSKYKDDIRIHWQMPSAHLPNALDSWNTAISLAQNPYVIVMGDDDYAMPWIHEEIQKGLKKADLVYTPVVDVDMHGRLLRKLPKYEEQVVSGDQFRYDIQFNKCNVSISGVTFKKKDFEAVGKYQDTLIYKYGLVDFFLWYRIAALQPWVAYSSRYSICICRLPNASDWVGGTLTSLVEKYHEFLRHLEIVEKALITMGVYKERLYKGKNGKQNWIDSKIIEYYLYLFRYYLKNRPSKLLSLTKEFIQSPISKEAIFKLPTYIISVVFKKIVFAISRKVNTTRHNGKV